MIVAKYAQFTRVFPTFDLEAIHARIQGQLITIKRIETLQPLHQCPLAAEERFLCEWLEKLDQKCIVEDYLNDFGFHGLTRKQDVVNRMVAIGSHPDIRAQRAVMAAIGWIKRHGHEKRNA